MLFSEIIKTWKRKPTTSKSITELDIVRNCFFLFGSLFGCLVTACSERIEFLCLFL